MPNYPYCNINFGKYDTNELDITFVINEKVSFTILASKLIGQIKNTAYEYAREVLNELYDRQRGSCIDCEEGNSIMNYDQWYRSRIIYFTMGAQLFQLTDNELYTLFIELTQMSDPKHLMPEVCIHNTERLPVQLIAGSYAFECDRMSVIDVMEELMSISDRQKGFYNMMIVLGRDNKYIEVRKDQILYLPFDVIHKWKTKLDTYVEYTSGHIPHKGESDHVPITMKRFERIE